MKRHLLVGTMGAKDVPSVDTGTDEVRSDVQLLNAGGIACGIQTALNDLRKLDLVPDEIGLDILIGAIDSLTKDEMPLLVSHAGEGAGSKAQYLCHAELKARFPKRRFEWVRLPMVFAHDLAEGVGSETSTRARSFLFFAFG